jgi:uncharacterized OB-fold protein
MSDAHSGKRIPRSTALSAPYWEGCRNRQLLIQRCGKCRHHQFYPRSICTACMAEDPEWVESGGHGTVRSFTVIRHPVSKAYAEEVPYVIALIQLDEGPVMMSSLLDCEPENARTGARVEVVFEDWTDEVTMPKFRPLGDG